MGQPAAKKGDQITGSCTHTVMVPSPPGPPTPTPTPGHVFAGIIDNGLSSNVKIMGQPAATVDSTATNTPSHIPMAPGTAFQTPPQNKATIKKGSGTVKINGKAAARAGDTAETCDEMKTPGAVVAVGTVSIGG
ncbi:MAG: PAAR domain-containing protein [Anaerolineae bacterium]